LIGIILQDISQERIASQCVCCGSIALYSSPAILMPFVAARTFGWYPAEIDDTWGLNSIKKGMAYSICNSLNCKKCGHLFLDIRFSDSEMAKLYSNYRGPDYVRLRESFESGYAVRNERLNHGVSFLDLVESFLIPYVSMPLTVLDWGGDTGVNTPFLKSAEKIDIYDISDKAVIEGVGRVSLEEAHNNKYKLVVCSQVLEHVSFPVDVIRSLKRCMDTNSILYIELPCENLIRASDEQANLAIRKKHWHEHINFYTKNSLQALLEYSNLTIVELRVAEVPMGESLVYIYQVAAKLK